MDRAAMRETFELHIRTARDAAAILSPLPSDIVIKILDQIIVMYADGLFDEVPDDPDATVSNKMMLLHMLQRTKIEMMIESLMRGAYAF
jgi:hypothetical protein